MTTNKKPIRTKRIYSYLTPSEKSFLGARAREKGLTLSNMIRELVLRYQKNHKRK